MKELLNFLKCTGSAQDCIDLSVKLNESFKNLILKDKNLGGADANLPHITAIKQNADKTLNLTFEHKASAGRSSTSLQNFSIMTGCAQPARSIDDID